MKKMLAYAGIALLFLAACQKNNDTAAVKETEKLTTSSAKEWYYGTFKKGTEWQQSAQKGKKLPDWKNGITLQFGNYEVADFPLLKQQFSVPLFENENLSEENKKRVADAAIHRITFFKDKKGNIAVRQLTFVPDFEYLRQKGFDISSNTFGNIDDNYSGLLVVQKWNEEFVVISKIRNGKITNRYKMAKADNAVESADCNGTLVTEYERYCEVTISSDLVVTEECGAWMPTGNQWCFEDDPGGGDPCTDPESALCACAGYGLCDMGGGGDEPPTCEEISCEEAADMVNSSTTTVASDGSYETGAETNPDENGIIRRSVVIHRHAYIVNYGLWFSERWELFFNAVQYRSDDGDTQWKWESVAFDQAKKVSGNTPGCLSTTVSATIAPPIISADKFLVTFSGIATIQKTANCLWSTSRTDSEPVGGSYYAGSF